MRVNAPAKTGFHSHIVNRFNSGVNCLLC